MRTCTVNDCSRKHLARGYCNLHYCRWQRGVPLTQEPPIIKWATAHDRARKLWGSAKLYPCVACGNSAAHWAYDGTDPGQHLGAAPRTGSNGSRVSYVFYSEWPEFYMPMCAKCHARRDGGKMSAELREYREWRVRTGITLADCTCSSVSALAEELTTFGPGDE